MEATINEPKPIQVSEIKASRILGLCPKTLFNRRKAKKIAFVRDGNRIMYRLDELERYSKANEVAANG
ncbi:MAG: hypothetical protein C0485_09965 [Pirellula sp.]|nr:hypothetical protein [Pirellula sp.]